MSKIPIVTIDSGVPTPARAHYPIEQLKVGESFLFPANKRASVQARASRIKADTGREYTVKKMDKDNCRIWRIK